MKIVWEYVLILFEEELVYFGFLGEFLYLKWVDEDIIGNDVLGLILRVLYMIEVRVWNENLVC